MFKITLHELLLKFPKVFNMKYLDNNNNKQMHVERRFLRDELLWFCQSKTQNTARLQADCRAIVVLALVLMTDFIDWKIKSL